jgi:hypothetical protein
VLSDRPPAQGKKLGQLNFRVRLAFSSDRPYFARKGRSGE